MADTHREGEEQGEEQDLEAPEEEMDDENNALLHLSKYREAQFAKPWEQWTFRDKANYYMDRIFLGLLVTFLVIFIGECGYKIWYLTNVNAIVEFVSDLVVFLFDWLFTQDRQEQVAEL